MILEKNKRSDTGKRVVRELGTYLDPFSTAPFTEELEAAVVFTVLNLRA